MLKTNRSMKVIIFLLLLSTVVICRSGGSSSGQPAEQEVTEVHEKMEMSSQITNTIGQTFVWINPGTFIMGSPYAGEGVTSDERQHQVTLTRGFYMQTTEVTQGQWKAVMSDSLWKRIMWVNPSVLENCGDDCPVGNVNWNDAHDFIKKLNIKEGTGKYRLPTEAEWEYAARAGTTTIVYCGSRESCLDGIAWYRDNSGATPHPVGQKQPNQWGLYDMIGNVSEWVEDRYVERDYAAGSVTTDPKGPSRGRRRVYRGGSWKAYAAWDCRSAARGAFVPEKGVDCLYNVYYERGFRLVWEK